MIQHQIEEKGWIEKGFSRIQDILEGSGEEPKMLQKVKERLGERQK